MTVSRFHTAFMRIITEPEHSAPLKSHAMAGKLTGWTQALTGAVVETCRAVDWRASAKGHKLDLLPVARHEYLGLDVVAFAGGVARWQFPVAVFELENSKDDDKIAYSLWKVLAVQAELRAVFCYRARPDQGAALIAALRDEVIGALGLTGRMALTGEVLVVVGSRAQAETFPYGFFKWWQLEPNTGAFRVL